MTLKYLTSSHVERVCYNFTLFIIHLSLFSEQSPPVAPVQVFTEFRYHGTKHSWKPAVTWVENINPWRVRACVAAPGGAHDDVLSEGKLSWLAIYDFTNTLTEKHGTIQYNPPTNQPFTTSHICFNVNFPSVRKLIYSIIVHTYCI